jgi:hypothetical protein
MYDVYRHICVYICFNSIVFESYGTPSCSLGLDLFLFPSFCVEALHYVFL